MEVVNQKVQSTDSDWCVKDGRHIIVWPGTILSENEIPEFKEFIERNGGTNPEYIGSFNYRKLTYLVFVAEVSGRFAIRRIELGMKWWFDIFSDVNTNFIYSELCDDFEKIISKLGLEMKID